MTNVINIVKCTATSFGNMSRHIQVGVEPSAQISCWRHRSHISFTNLDAWSLTFLWKLFLRLLPMGVKPSNTGKNTQFPNWEFMKIPKFITQLWELVSQSWEMIGSSLGKTFIFDVGKLIHYIGNVYPNIGKYHGKMLGLVCDCTFV